MTGKSGHDHVLTGIPLTIIVTQQELHRQQESNHA